MRNYEILWQKADEPLVINTMHVCARTENDARNLFHSVNPYTLVSITQEGTDRKRKEPTAVGAAEGSRKNIFTAFIIALFRAFVKMGACKSWR